jgi:hypothetical protein
MICSLTPYILLSLSLIANLIGFLVLVHETRLRDQRANKRFDDLERKVRAAQSFQPASQPEIDFAPATARSGLNFSKRAQAMRMFRRNEVVSHIAAALGVARREVELLIRVQKMTTGLGQIFQSPFRDPLCTLQVQ